MSRNSKKAAVAIVAAADVQVQDGVVTETYDAVVVQLTKGAKVNGKLQRSGTYLTDLDDELAAEIVACGAGEYVTVGVPVAAAGAEAPAEDEPAADDTADDETTETA